MIVECEEIGIKEGIIKEQERSTLPSADRSQLQKSARYSFHDS